MDKKNSGVGVLDKAVRILGVLESGPHSLSELVAATKIARPTAHRLAVENGREFYTDPSTGLTVMTISATFAGMMLICAEPNMG